MSLMPLALAGILATTPGPLADAPDQTLVQIDPVCEPVERMPLEGRASPYDSVATTLGEALVKVCYGRPSARDRTMIGGEAVPFGQLWRTGANEATVLHTTGPIMVGGVALPAGSYSVYTIPGEETWEVFFSRSTDHWGLAITDEVRGQEVGSAQVTRQRPEEHVETFTIAFRDGNDDTTHLIMEWEEFRISLPVIGGGEG